MAVMKWLKCLCIVILSLLCMFSSCPPKVYTPPTRLWAGETPAPLEKNKQAVGVNSGAHTSSLGPWGGIGLIGTSGSLFYRRGVTDNLEIGADIGLLNLNPAGEDPDVNPLAGSLRLAVKYSPTRYHKFASARLGAGLGTSGAGQYCSFDGGINLGWETVWATPLANFGGFLSVPFNAEMINFSKTDSAHSEFYADRAEVTYGFDAAAGIKIRLVQPKTHTLVPSLLIMAGLAVLDTRYYEDPETFFSFGGGLEFSF